MHNIKRWRFLLVGVTFAMIAAACGDSATTTTTTTVAPTSTTAATTTTTADLSGENIEVLASWAEDSAEGQNFKLVMDAFTAMTGVTFTYQGASSDLVTVLSTRVEANNPPDVAFLPQPGTLIDYADRGALIPIEDVVGTTVDTNYAPVWRDLGSSDGTLYGVWFKGANKSTVWYDPAAMTAAGAAIPTTWDEWIAACETLVDAGVACVDVAGADGWTLSDWFENTYLRTAGAEMYDKLQNHEIPWTDQSVKDALTTLGQILTEDNMAGGSAQALQTGFVDSVTGVFTNHDAAMVYEGDFVAGVILGETDAEAGTGFDFFDWPSINGSEPAVVGGGDVAVALTDRAATMAFLQFLATPEAASIWAAQGGFSSMNKNVDVSIYPDDITRRAAASLASATSFRFDLSDLVPPALGGTAGAGIWGALQQWLANPGDVDAILAQLDTEATAAQG